MAIRYLLPEEGRFYKANLHAHSTYSDGKLTVAQAKEHYKRNGYSVYAYTDHNSYQHHDELNDEGFLALAGFESDFTQPQQDIPWPWKRTFHINFIDAEPDRDADRKRALAANRPDGYDVGAINRYIEQLTALGCLATYNHPYWSLQDYTDYAALTNLFAMEIGNYGCQVEGNYGFAPQAYDEMLRSGQRIFCLSTDDNHNRHDADSPNADSFGGYVMIKAAQLSYPSVIAALKSGAFYSVNGIDGPQIHALYIDGDELVVRCTDAKAIYLKNDTRNGAFVRAAKGEYLSGARLSFRGDEGYIRVEVVDEFGRTAYSNAYFMDGIADA